MYRMTEKEKWSRTVSNCARSCFHQYANYMYLPFHQAGISWITLSKGKKIRRNVAFMHQSIPAAPSPPPPSSPPGYCRAFARLVSPEDEAFANFAKFVKACSRFYACISSLLIKPELHSENGSYRLESTFFWLLNQISVDVIEEHPFLFIKLFITVNFTLHY